MKHEIVKNLATGNVMIDRQHREIIEKIEKLINCCKEGGGKIEAVKMLDYLADYTDYHFKEEEELQEAYSCPGLQEHRKRHEELRQVVADLYEMLREEEGPSDAFVEAVNKNVKEWLFGHIKTYDRDMAAYIVNSQEKAS